MMVLSLETYNDKEALQTYWNNLHGFWKWFIPKKLQEKLDNFVTLNFAQDDDAPSKFFSLCFSFTYPSWYERFVMYWFSGLYVFSQSKTMQTVRACSQYDLFDPDRFSVLVQALTLDEGFQGLRLLKDTAVTPVAKLNDVIQSILHISALTLAENIKKDIYQAVVRHRDPLVFAQAVGNLVRSDILFKKIYLAIEHAAQPGLLADAFVALEEMGLLDTLDSVPHATSAAADGFLAWQKQVLQRDIYVELLTREHPDILTMAIQRLVKDGIFDRLVWEELQKTKAPIELADLMAQFYKHNKFDQRILPQLDEHRRNMVVLEGVNIRIQPTDNALDLIYCAQLARFAQAGLLSGAEAQANEKSFRTSYAQLERAEAVEVFVDALIALHQHGLLQGKIGVQYRSAFAKIEKKIMPTFVEIIVLCETAGTFETEEDRSFTLCQLGLDRSLDLPTILSELKKPSCSKSIKEILGLIAQQNLKANPNQFLPKVAPKETIISASQQAKSADALESGAEIEEEQQKEEPVATPGIVSAFVTSFSSWMRGASSTEINGKSDLQSVESTPMVVNNV